MHLKQIISDEEYFDGQKRSQYGNRWNRPPSSIANKEYLQRIESTHSIKQICKRKQKLLWELMKKFQISTKETFNTSIL